VSDLLSRHSRSEQAAMRGLRRTSEDERENVLRTSTGPMGPPAPPLISSEFRFVLLLRGTNPRESHTLFVCCGPSDAKVQGRNEQREEGEDRRGRKLSNHVDVVEGARELKDTGSFFNSTSNGDVFG
jgi:hypothetical protein